MQHMKMKRLEFLSIFSTLVCLKQNILYAVFLICFTLISTFSISALTSILTLNKEKYDPQNRHSKEVMVIRVT